MNPLPEQAWTTDAAQYEPDAFLGPSELVLSEVTGMLLLLIKT